jgi:hypothetical protein
LPHFQIATLPHFQIATLPHFHIATLLLIPKMPHNPPTKQAVFQYLSATDVVNY